MSQFLKYFAVRPGGSDDVDALAVTFRCTCGQKQTHQFITTDESPPCPNCEALWMLSVTRRPAGKMWENARQTLGGECPADELHELRQAVNSPVQGLGADVCYLSGIGGTAWLKENRFHTGEVNSPTCEILTVHDSWLYECHDDLLDKVAPHWAGVLTHEYPTATGEMVRFPADVKVDKRWKTEWEGMPIPSVEALRKYISTSCEIKEAA